MNIREAQAMARYCCLGLLIFLPSSLSLASESTTSHNDARPYYAAPPRIKEAVALQVPNADGIAIGDITGNGKMDLLTSDGDGGNTLWFEQGRTWKEWTRHPIHHIESGPTEIEGNALGDFDGDGRLEAISLNQPNGDIYLHKYLNDARGVWDSAVIQSGRPLLQDAMPADITGNGRIELVYTWEGRNEGQGGVHWLELTGDDPLDAASWQDHVMTQHESAWWLAPRRVDISGNGDAVDFVFTARHLVGRNPGSKPGLFWMEPGEDVTEPWTVHTIDDTLPHPLHVDIGNLSAKEHDLDLVVGGFDTEQLYWFAFDPEQRNWTRHALPLPSLDEVQPDTIWNVKALRYGADRDSIFVAANRKSTGAWLLYDYIDGKYTPRVLRRFDYPHPTEDRILLHDVTDDGQAELFLPDSGPGENKLHILQLDREW